MTLAVTCKKFVDVLKILQIKVAKALHVGKQKTLSCLEILDGLKSLHLYYHLD